MRAPDLNLDLVTDDSDSTSVGRDKHVFPGFFISGFCSNYKFDHMKSLHLDGTVSAVRYVDNTHASDSSPPSQPRNGDTSHVRDLPPEQPVYGLPDFTADEASEVHGPWHRPRRGQKKEEERINSDGEIAKCHRFHLGMHAAV